MSLPARLTPGSFFLLTCEQEALQIVLAAFKGTCRRSAEVRETLQRAGLKPGMVTFSEPELEHLLEIVFPWVRTSFGLPGNEKQSDLVKKILNLLEAVLCRNQ